ncbi:hypothetical protein ACFTAO_20650 [Paenibacillus rhizoplanae]
MAIGLQQFIEDHPDAVEEYLLSTASLGYKMYLVNADGEERFYGLPFRKKMTSRRRRCARCWTGRSTMGWGISPASCS